MAKKLTMQVVVAGAEKAMGKIKAVGETFKKKGFLGGLQSLGKAGMAIGAIAGGIFTIGFAAKAAMGKVLRLTAELDRIAKSANRIGITAEAFQKLEFAAALSGSSFEQVERAFKRMQKAIFDFRSGSAIAKRAFEQLGITIKDIDRQAPDEIFRMIAKRLEGIKDVNVKKGLSQVIMGRAGTDIGPMIRDIEALDAKFAKFGLTIKEKTLRGAEDLVDELEILRRQARVATSDSGIIQWAADAAAGVNELVLEIRNLGKELNKLPKKEEASGFWSDFWGGIMQGAKLSIGAMTAPHLVLADLFAKKGKGKAGVNRGKGGLGGGLIQNPEDLIPGAKGPKPPTDALLRIGGMVTPLAAKGQSNPIVAEVKITNELLRSIDQNIKYLENDNPVFFDDVPDPNAPNQATPTPGRSGSRVPLRFRK
jgi:gas vesicle protein